jgi:hypothetical protein
MASIDPTINDKVASENDEENASLMLDAWILYILYAFMILSNLIAIVLHWRRYKMTDSSIHAVYITTALGKSSLNVS